ncbi:MAG: twitch domain-containing radical SAM protein [Flavobacteriales bacterium]|nr:twitch domain-containing radical SAM protein [Flavobacteriales bacterium]
MRNPEASDFCYYPFMQILLTSDGRYRPCSKHQDYITHQGRELSIHHGDDMQDAWTSDYMQDIRQHFLENRQFEGCRECWRMQRMGLRSMRYDSYQYGTSENQVSEPITPTRIEINASNICNLRCRICYPNASSKWIKEHGELYGSNEKVYRNLPLPNLEQVKGWTQSLEEVCFFGGEPLLSEENMELLDHFISSGNAERMSLLFNTNGTVFSEEIIERLRPFKRVRMYFSVDDIGDRFEYQRKGANWDEVAKNIEKAYRLSRSPEGQNIDFKICCTVSILNIYYFPEFFDYFGKNFPGLRIFWNLLFDPWELSIQLLPNEVKEVLRERLSQELRPSFVMNEEDTRTVGELIGFLSPSIKRNLSGFFRYVQAHDKYRGESFAITFPELDNLLKPYMDDKQTKPRPPAVYFRSNSDLYPAYSMFEGIRNNNHSNFSETSFKILFDGLVELSEEFATTDQFVRKVQWLRDNIECESLGAQDLLRHSMVAGLLKLHDTIAPMGFEEFKNVMKSRFGICESFGNLKPSRYEKS